MYTPNKQEKTTVIMKICFCLARLWSLGIFMFGMMGSQFATANLTSSPLSPRIGVIGGGPAGICTAYFLQKKGYDNIVVFEKKDRVGGFANTQNVDGKAYDLSMMIIPAGNIMGAGIDPKLQEMINISKEPISSAVDFYTLDTVENMQFLEIIPEPLQEYETSDIISQLLTGLSLSTQLAQCLRDDTKCDEDCDICTATIEGEHLLAWGDRVGLPAYAKLAVYVMDGLGVGPKAVTPITPSLTVSEWSLVDAAELLRNLGVTPENLPTEIPPNIASLLGGERWISFDNGFQVFWESIVRESGIETKTSSGVLDMSYDGTVWEVTIEDGSIYEFDYVIVTAAPQDAIKFLPEGPQQAIVKTAIPIQPFKDAFLVRTSDSNIYDTDVDNDVVGFWPTGFGQGTPSMGDPSVGGFVKPIFWQKRHDDNNIFVVGCLNLANSSDSILANTLLERAETYPNTSMEYSLDRVKEYAKETLGLHIEEVIAQERYLFPSGPSDDSVWEDTWKQLQGQDSLWFNGEAFTGPGVPRIVRYTDKFVDRLDVKIQQQQQEQQEVEEEELLQNSSGEAMSPGICLFCSTMLFQVMLFVLCSS